MTATPAQPPILLIISGLSATGKTTLAKRIAAHFSLPLVSKDIIKETLCDALGCTELVESQRIGYASIVLMYRFAESVLRAGKPCLIESFFRPDLAVPDILELQQHCAFLPVQIHCRAEMSVLIGRRKKRLESGERHPGHMDHVRQLIPVQPEEYFEPLPIGGHVFDLDTTDFEKIDYEQLFSWIDHSFVKGST